MKNHIITLIIVFLFTLMSCHEEPEADKGSALRNLIVNSQWKLFKTKSSTDTDFSFASPSSAHVYSIKDDGRYLVKYPSSFDTIYVEGDWSVQSKPLVVDFINHDKIYRYQAGEIPNLFGTPTDWNIVTSDSIQLEIEGIKGDSLLGYRWILRKFN